MRAGSAVWYLRVERSRPHHQEVSVKSSLVLFLAVALLLTQPLPAAACGTVGPDWDPRDHTQLLVLGRARSIELGPGTRFGYVEATVTLEVIEVFRGTASSPLRFVDSASVASIG